MSVQQQSFNHFCEHSRQCSKLDVKHLWVNGRICGSMDRGAVNRASSRVISVELGLNFKVSWLGDLSDHAGFADHSFEVLHLEGR